MPRGKPDYSPSNFERDYRLQIVRALNRRASAQEALVGGDSAVIPGAVTAVAIDCPSPTTIGSLVPSIKIAACTAIGEGWAGCEMWESFDGTTWTPRGTLSTQAGIGELAEAIAAGTAAEEYGSTTITTHAVDCDVTLTCTGPFGIEGATEAQAVAGKNWVAIIDADGAVEIAAFKTAVLVSGSTYTLSNWLRGLRGTTPGAHVSGCRVVLLSPFYGSGVEHLEYPGLIQPTAMRYKLVAPGQVFGAATEVQIVCRWRNALPLPVRSVTKTIGASPFNARFTIDAHWCRQVLALGKQPPHPMDEQFEGYRFSIYEPTGTHVVRIYNLAVTPTSGAMDLRDQWFDYSATSQTSDGYTPSGTETFWIDVQQIGEFGLGPSIKQEI